MKKPNLNQAKLSLINRRERQILVHSCIYYELDQNIISDYDFDLWSKELVGLMESYPNEFKASEYFGEFKEFTGASGAFLNYRLVHDKALQLLKLAKKFN